ncbi:MAG TPA: ROK family protein [Clostridia bacterium]
MKVLGFDIGGTKCACVLAEFDKEDISFLYRKEVKTLPEPQTTLQSLISEAMIWIEKEQIDVNTLKTGISCGGPLDEDSGLIINPPNLRGWENFPICDFIQDKISLKIKPKLKNDANACCLAEWRFGAGVGCHNMIFLTFGTGLGAGLLLNGNIYNGTTGTAGEVGHIRMSETGPYAYGKYGSMEGFCSGAGIRNLAIEIGKQQIASGKGVSYAKDEKELNEITTQKLAQLAEEGDEDAKMIFRISGEYFGKGLAILVDIINPQVIVAGGVYARCHKFIDDSMWEHLKREALPMAIAKCKVVPSKLGEKIGDYGAVISALY